VKWHHGNRQPETGGFRVLTAQRQQDRHLASIQETADYLGTSTKTVRRYIAAGRLKAYRLGDRAVRVDLDELDQALRPIPTARPSGDAA
jgi:excisionase family DNA binding protein